MKKEANIFLKIVETSFDEFKNWKIGKTNTSINDIFTDIRAKLSDTTLAQKIIIQQTKFQQALNKFLGREILLTYINTDGSVIFLTTQEEIELYKQSGYGQGPHAGRLSGFTDKQVESLQKEAVKNISDKFIDFANTRIKSKQSVYAEALRRYLKEDMDYKKRQPELQKTFYWWKSKDRTVLRHNQYAIDNQGRLGEAYIDYVFNNQDSKTYTYDKNIDLMFEDQLEKMAFIDFNRRIFSYKKNTYIYDFIPAVVKGDVTINKEDAEFAFYQFAVKTGVWNSPGTVPYIRAAYNIQKADYLTPEFLNKYLANFSRGISSQSIAGKVIKTANQMAKNEIKKIHLSNNFITMSYF